MRSILQEVINLIYNLDTLGKSLLYVDGHFSGLAEEPLKFSNDFPEHNVWETALKIHGYDPEPMVTLGKEGAFWLEVYHATMEGFKQKATHKYLVTVGIGGYGKQLIYVNIYTHLLKLLGELSPIASTVEQPKQRNGTVTYFNRVF